MTPLSNMAYTPPLSPPLELGSLQTESQNANTSDIDRVSTLEMCGMESPVPRPDTTDISEEIINKEDAKIANAVHLCLPEVARIIDMMAPKVLKGGRVIYIGAGTSGRSALSHVSNRLAVLIWHLGWVF